MKNKKLYKTKKNRIKRKLRIRSTVSGTAERPRLTIYRSQRHIYAQLVDDFAGKTITGLSTLSPQLKSAFE